MKADYDCCTHYREKGYDDGYIMLPIFRVKVCRNCGECHAVWAQQRTFSLWGCSGGSGMERCISKTGRLWIDKPENLGYSIKLSNGREAAASLHPFRCPN